MTPDRRRESDPDDLRDRVDALEQGAGSSEYADMTPEEFAAAYEGGEVDVPGDDLPEPGNRATVGPVDPDAADDDWIFLRLFGTPERNIGGIRAPRAAIPDTFDPEEDFPV